MPKNGGEQATDGNGHRIGVQQEKWQKCGKKPLEKIEKKDEVASTFAKGTFHIGGSRIAATYSADVDALGFGNNNGKRQ